MVASGEELEKYFAGTVCIHDREQKAMITGVFTTYTKAAWMN